MRFDGRVWRYVPRGAHPLDFHFLIRAAGRWNRRGLYGCLYRALTPQAAVAEHRKHVRRRGLSRPRDLVALDVTVDPVFNVEEWAELQTGRRTKHSDQARWFWPPPDLGLGSLTGDDPADLEACRTLADWARTQGYLGLLAPCAAARGEEILAIYPENRPASLELRITDRRYPLNYGAEAIVDEEGRFNGLPE